MSIPAEVSIEYKELDYIASCSFLTERDIYQTTLDFIVDKIKSEIGYLHLYNESTEEINLAIWSGNVFKQCSTTHVSHYSLKDAGIWADCIRQRKTVLHNDYPSIANSSGLPEGHFPISSHMSSPIFDDDKIVGIIGIGNRKTPYDKNDIQQLEKLISLSWPIILNRIADIKHRRSSEEKLFQNQDIEEIIASMLHSVSKALELRDEYTYQHQLHVALICDKIAERLELPKQQRFGLKIGASIHDIGKIGIPSQILNKSGKLTQAEIGLLETHPKLGADLFRGQSMPWPIVEMIEQHHERMDGTGYPQGLLGQSICLEARIIAVADIFDAMSSDRPYRYAPGQEKAIKVIKEERGKGLDTYIVDAFLDIYKTDTHFFEENYK